MERPTGRNSLGVSIAIVVVLLTVVVAAVAWALSNDPLIAAALGGAVLVALIIIVRRARRPAPGRPAERKELAEGLAKDKQRVYNRSIRKPKSGPLWRSRTYALEKGDRLKVEVVADGEVSAQLVKKGGESPGDPEHALGPCRKCSKTMEVKEGGEYWVLVDTTRQKVVLTVKIDVLRAPALTG